MGSRGEGKWVNFAGYEAEVCVDGEEVVGV